MAPRFTKTLANFSQFSTNQGSSCYLCHNFLRRRYIWKGNIIKRRVSFLDNIPPLKKYSSCSARPILLEPGRQLYWVAPLSYLHTLNLNCKNKCKWDWYLAAAVAASKTTWPHYKPPFEPKNFNHNRIGRSWCQTRGNWGQKTRISHSFLEN